MSKRKPRSETDQAGGGQSDETWRRLAEAKLAGLYQAALEEPIPDDMLRLARMIGEHGSHKD